MLGRWGGDKSDAYVRTHRRRVGLMQAAVATAARGGRFGLDVGKTFDEEEIMEALSRHLRGKGVREGLIAVQLVRLRSAGASP
eukprot:11705253-Heterocapsa_arctica.AAC.1